MVAVHSTMLPLGAKAPDFVLPAAGGGVVSLASLVEGKSGLLVIFLCNHCPFVKHIRSVLKRLTDDFIERNIACVGINANDWATYPADTPEKMLEESRAAGYTFPYLYDETQETAKAYRAACTPDFYLFNDRRSLIFRGRFDASTPGNAVPVTGDELSAAVEDLLAGRPIFSAQHPSIGCNIKWKPGNEPDYFSG